MTSKRTYLSDARAAERAFSRAVITTGGRTIWLAGQTAAPGTIDFEPQVREVFARLGDTIKAAGGSGLRDMVTMTVFINDARNGDRFVQIRREHFPDGRYPCSALLTISGFARPGIVIEIQGVAVI